MESQYLKTQIDLSIIIVSMNKIDLLTDCLNSIINSVNKIEYEIIVVAYLFESSNLQLLKNKFTNILILENNKITGFSENNNLGAKIAKGRYCLILNDDTYIKEPLIDELYLSFKTLEKQDKKAAILSPILYFPDGSVQYNGREKMTYFDYFQKKFNINFLHKKDKYSNKQYLYQTYNISGACFMINTNIFKELGLFDERYFFCPEDIALSSLANEKGYKVFVDTNLSIYHIHQSSAKSLSDIIAPVMEIGLCLFYGRHHKITEYLLRFIIFWEACIKFLYWVININHENKKLSMKGFKNTMFYIFSSYTPKQLFEKLYFSKL